MKRVLFTRQGVVGALIFIVLISMFLTCSQIQTVDLEEGFQNPPNSARPRVWWHWMNGNVTKEGIKADFEWMNRVGIGGFQNFDAGLASPQIVEERLVYMTPEWKDAFQYTTRLADSFGLEMAIAGSPGWSESGGPWVTPEQGMKKYVWSETRVEGGQPFNGILPSPPTVTGSFQNIISAGRGFNEEAGESLPEYYADALVVAYRAPASEISLAELEPKITSSGGVFELAALTDGDLVQFVELPPEASGEKAWIQFEFSEPQTIHSLTMAIGGGGRRYGRGGGADGRTLEMSSDGRQFQIVAEISTGRVSQSTITFPPVTARFFRVAFITPEPQTTQFGMTGFGAQGAQAAPAGTQIAELVLHTGPRINRFEEKAGFATVTDVYSLATPEVDPTVVINQADVIDLTSKMDSDGSLDWTPPEGEWVVLRIGYSLTGQQNRPASPEATGLEVDKLNAEYVKAYFENYLNQYKDATGGLMGNRGLQYIITDSWEAGVANWTDDIVKEFRNRSGYDIIPWIPVLTGRIVESAESSERFLWDFRNTLEELVAEYHYDELTKILDGWNMGRYTESHEGGRAFIGDGMEVKRSADVPMSATWTPTGTNTTVSVRHKADVRESASVAHIYGQNLVAAESLTSGGDAWGFSPERLKPTADMELASGLNRFVIHTSVHQPVDDKIPGLGLGRFGQWFTRHETWAEQAEPWVSYLARSSFMLQQGQFVADVIYVYGEGTNITALFGNQLPPVPEGYNFDFLNAGAVPNVLSVKDGNITTKTGMSYSVLALDPSTQYMTLPVLKKIRDLVNGGAIVLGPKPIDTPSLSDDPAEFQSIADALWGEGNVGQGKIYTNQTIGDVLDDLGVEPDFEYTKPQNDTELLYVHRRMGETDIYWVNSRNARFEDLEATFRVEGKSAELWNPETGDIQPASYQIENGRTTVPLNLKPNDAVFVVFREATEELSRTLDQPVETQLTTISGSWIVRFQPDRGAPEQITLRRLTAWNQNANPGVKYFSGTGTYTKTIQAPESWFQEGTELCLDLGDVKNLAEVMVNGQSLGIVWKEPFRVNVTNALRPGENSLEIKVTNLWVNRLIGDQQPNIDKTYTYTTDDFYQADSALLPSGLLGPVEIVSLTAN